MTIPSKKHNEGKMKIIVGDIIKPTWSDNEFYHVISVHDSEGGVYASSIQILSDDELFFSYEDIDECYRKNEINSKTDSKLPELVRQLAAHFLEIASDSFGSHGCNDVEDKVFAGWTTKQRIDFVKGFHDWNGDPEEYDPSFLHLPDFSLMDYLAHLLRSPW